MVTGIAVVQRFGLCESRAPVLSSCVVIVTLQWPKRVHYISMISDDGTCACRTHHGGVPGNLSNPLGHDMHRDHGALQRRSEFSEPCKPYGVSFCRRVILPRPHRCFVQSRIRRHLAFVHLQLPGLVRSRRKKRFPRVHLPGGRYPPTSLLLIFAVSSYGATNSRRLPGHLHGNEFAPEICRDVITLGLLSSLIRYASTAAISGSSETCLDGVRVRRGQGLVQTCLSLPVASRRGNTPVGRIPSSDVSPQ